MGTPANCGSTLQQGSRCDQVCVLQQNLDNMSLYTSSANGGNPDGEYGPDTTAAVKQYQLEYNAEPGHSNTLRTDGVADPATQQAIASDPILGGGSGSPPAPAGSGVQPGSGSPPAPAASSGDCASMGLDSVNGICVPKSGFSSGSIAGATNLVSLVLLVLKYLLILSGLIATVALVVGGFWYITAAGNEEQAEKGRKALLNAIIGMVIIIMAYAIVNILTATLTTTDITKTT
jgi:peptidoglycan hydrolase-like protein with peptidoglycan-binding domain